MVGASGVRRQDVDLLLHLCHAEKLDYRIIARCWPHRTDRIADHFPDLVHPEVELLTRDGLGATLRERGITRPSVIMQLLTRGDGRPAWALDIADLLIDTREWRSAWTGNSLREQIFVFLRMSNTAEDAVDVPNTLESADHSRTHRVLRAVKNDVELLRKFGRLGPEKVQAVIDIHLARVDTMLDSGNPRIAESEAQLLAAPQWPGTSTGSTQHRPSNRHGRAKIRRPRHADPEPIRLGRLTLKAHVDPQLVQIRADPHQWPPTRQPYLPTHRHLFPNMCQTVKLNMNAHIVTHPREPP
ncbi:hypothetical protein D3I60_00605 [Brevibacterium permense]|nr:hypothetical protein [Brevibacterium permense]